ncbi:short-chain dehydrogenase/reductase family protein [Favolaschia claudopus]|uniref:Short-chain dehydrogenase/reductase family protein n=1 Tax=Favolaschia claudopus TaxID=2862362 RepID=A0AAW0AYC1_9AGAR
MASENSQLHSVLVSGTNQGLGYHTVHQLGAAPNTLVFMGARKLAAAEEARAKFAADIHPSSTVVPIQLDITDPTSIKNARDFVEKYLKEKGLTGLDALVNNAAIAIGSFQDVYAVNVFGTSDFTQAIRPLIKKNGAIVNVSSTMGSLHYHTQRPAPTIAYEYSSSKSALNSLTLQWAIEEEQKGSGVRVVCICPGYNATKMNGFAGTMDPADGCKIIVKTALAKEGRSGVFINKDGDVKW